MLDTPVMTCSLCLAMLAYTIKSSSEIASDTASAAHQFFESRPRGLLRLYEMRLGLEKVDGRILTVNRRISERANQRRGVAILSCTGHPVVMFIVHQILRALSSRPVLLKRIV